MSGRRGVPVHAAARTTFESPLPPATTWDELLVNQQIQITPSTTITGWTGEALDVHHAGDGLMQRVQRMKLVSAEPPVGYD